MDEKHEEVHKTNNYLNGHQSLFQESNLNFYFSFIFYTFTAIVSELLLFFFFAST